MEYCNLGVDNLGVVILDETTISGKAGIMLQQHKL